MLAKERNQSHRFLILAAQFRQRPLVQAELSDFVSKASWDQWRRLREQDDFAVLPVVGHMAPLEAPRKTARVVTDWLYSQRAGN